MYSFELGNPYSPACLDAAQESRSVALVPCHHGRASDRVTSRSYTLHVSDLLLQRDIHTTITLSSTVLTAMTAICVRQRRHMLLLWRRICGGAQVRQAQRAGAIWSRIVNFISANVRQDTLLEEKVKVLLAARTEVRCLRQIGVPQQVCAILAMRKMLQRSPCALQGYSVKNIGP